MKNIDILKLAWDNVKANLLRSFLTLLIIALGVMALVGILTAIDGIIYSMSNNFGFLGANSFSIDRKSNNFHGNHNRRAEKEAPPIVFSEAIDFKERFSDRAIVTISYGASFSSTVKYLNKKTSPTVRVRGIDENYFKVTGYEIETGRNFSTHELENGQNIAIIGMDLVKKLFLDDAQKALGKEITVNDQKYSIVGVLKFKGASMNDGADRRIFIPLLRSKIDFASTQSNFNLAVAAHDATQIERLTSEAIGEMRIVRGIRAYDENDFEIFKSDGIVEFLKENTVKLRAATIAIGLMTLLGAAIGLMNIMLVSVTERTKEIGIAKALGATRKTIQNQFLAEALIICFAGGILGILLAIPLGNIMTFIMKGPFIIPWAWIGLGLFVCLLVGILSGLYPALKAAALDPVDSLRHE